ncbi:MAG: LytTR family DNA-binding domain-containing protein [Bacteroidota bacterium]
MNILIIEDEIPAAEKLERLLLEYNDANNIVGKAGSIKKAVDLISSHRGQYDLVFMDIQLTDGKSFEIFKRTEVEKPVIFLTAFDQYAIEAFKVNGVDYLLKPLTFEALSNSLEKFEKLREQFQNKPLDLSMLAEALSKGSGKSYKSRFLVKVGDHIRSVITDDIAFFFAEGRTAFLVTKTKDKYVVDFKLETLEDILDPAMFLRVNRTFILNISSISDVLVYSNSRLRVSTFVDFDKEIIVSREKVGIFKDWYGGS